MTSASGRAFSVNAHGWPVPYLGRSGSTVRSLRLVMGDGSLVNCSRARGDAELFRFAMGGYGLVGVIVELDVEMAPNVLLTPAFVRMEAEKFAPAFIKAIESDPNNAQRLQPPCSLARDKFFDEALMIPCSLPATPQPEHLPEAASSRAMMGIHSEASIVRRPGEIAWAKRARWLMGSHRCLRRCWRVRRPAIR